ncbi:unnamed protein product [Brassicogethes aeneus]|uniref:Uncharacterized protein n=1 Tax=Brassicogethes aeneus TaxID=1431903 RepID=A0A9P0FJ06_BRAAE|nr:unnamed protein product [Brassicogethes aeneus]
MRSKLKILFFISIVYPSLQHAIKAGGIYSGAYSSSSLASQSSSYSSSFSGSFGGTNINDIGETIKGGPYSRGSGTYGAAAGAYAGASSAAGTAAAVAGTGAGISSGCSSGKCHSGSVSAIKKEAGSYNSANHDEGQSEGNFGTLNNNLVKGAYSRSDSGVANNVNGKYSGSNGLSKLGCCQGPFPGPNKGIYDSKPAYSVPAIKPEGYAPNPTYATHQTSHPTVVKPDLSGGYYASKPVTPTAASSPSCGPKGCGSGGSTYQPIHSSNGSGPSNKPVIPVGASTPSNGPPCGSKGCNLGSSTYQHVNPTNLPGSSGGIYASKPATPVTISSGPSCGSKGCGSEGAYQPVNPSDSQGLYQSVNPSNLSGGGIYASKPVTPVGGSNSPSCGSKGCGSGDSTYQPIPPINLPGSSGGIYASKPVARIANSPSCGSGSKACASTGTGPQYQPTIPNHFPGASGGIYSSKPVSGPQISLDKHEGHKVIKIHFTVGQFPGPSGGIYHSKPASSVVWNNGKPISNAGGNYGIASGSYTNTNSGAAYGSVMGATYNQKPLPNKPEEIDNKPYNPTHGVPVPVPGPIIPQTNNQPNPNYVFKPESAHTKIPVVPGTSTEAIPVNNLLPVAPAQPDTSSGAYESDFSTLCKYIPPGASPGASCDLTKVSGGTVVIGGGLHEGQPGPSPTEGLIEGKPAVPVSSGSVDIQTQPGLSCAYGSKDCGSTSEGLIEGAPGSSISQVQDVPRNPSGGYATGSVEIQKQPGGTYNPINLNERKPGPPTSILPCTVGSKGCGSGGLIEGTPGAPIPGIHDVQIPSGGGYATGSVEIQKQPGQAYSPVKSSDDTIVYQNKDISGYYPQDGPGVPNAPHGTEVVFEVPSTQTIPSANTGGKGNVIVHEDGSISFSNEASEAGSINVQKTIGSGNTGGSYNSDGGSLYGGYGGGYASSGADLTGSSNINKAIVNTIHKGGYGAGGFGISGVSSENGGGGVYSSGPGFATGSVVITKPGGSYSYGERGYAGGYEGSFGGTGCSGNCAGGHHDHVKAVSGFLNNLFGNIGGFGQSGSYAKNGAYSSSFSSASSNSNSYSGSGHYIKI